MNRMPKAEKVLLVVGLSVFLVSAFLFIFETDRLSQLLGITSGSSRSVVAKVETFKDMARRKTMDSPEFQPVIEKQTIFSQDTIMTGSGSGIVLAFNNGDVVELGPDTLVQIQTTNPNSDSENLEFILDVQKGQVTGKSTSEKIHVKQNGAVAVLKPITENNIAAYLVYPKQKPKVAACHFGTKQLKAPDLASITEATAPAKAGDAPVKLAPPRPKVFVEVSCEGDVSSTDVTVKNKKGETLQALSIDIGPDHQGKFEFFVNAPDTYSIEMKQETPEKVSITVPAAYETLSWDAPGLRCDYGVAWKALPKMGKKLGLYEENGKPVKETAVLATQHFSFLQNTVKLPKNLYLQQSLGNGFALRTPLLPIQSWRSCPVLKIPGDEAKKVLNLRIPILFTWSSISHEDHYQFEVASDAEFKDVLYEVKTEQNLSRYNPKKKGVFYWRVLELRSHSISDVYEFAIH